MHVVALLGDLPEDALHVGLIWAASNHTVTRVLQAFLSSSATLPTETTMRAPGRRIPRLMSLRLGWEGEAASTMSMSTGLSTLR